VLHLACSLALIGATQALAQSTNPAIFVTNNVGDSVTSFTVNPNGTLTRVAAFPSGDGPQTVSLSPNGRWLSVANGTASTTTEELRIFEVNPDATLTLRLTTTVPDSPLDVQWMSNDHIAVAQTGLGLVRSYNYNSAANTFVQDDIESAGGFTSRLALSHGGRVLYANSTSGGQQISVFTVNPNGTLQFVEAEPVSFAVDMASTPDSRFVYGAGGISGDGNRIYGFTADPNTGALTPMSTPSFTSPGESPKNQAFTADGKIAVFGHGTDATIQSFFIDGNTGFLTPTGFSFDVGGQGTLGDIQIMGDLMFATDTSTATDGITGVYSFRVNPDGSFSQLGTIQDTLGARPEYIATWNGVPEPGSAGIMIIALSALGAMRRRK
jgi:6-phosphogluconolactonase (cycloisomerase 2 family)